MWRLLSNGAMQRLPAADYDGMPLSPGYLVTGPSRLLLAVPYNQPDLPTPMLLVSYDEGESWRVEQVPE